MFYVCVLRIMRVTHVALIAALRSYYGEQVASYWLLYKTTFSFLVVASICTFLLRFAIMEVVLRVRRPSVVASGAIFCFLRACCDGSCFPPFPDQQRRRVAGA